MDPAVAEGRYQAPNPRDVVSHVGHSKGSGRACVTVFPSASQRGHSDLGLSMATDFQQIRTTRPEQNRTPPRAYDEDRATWSQPVIHRRREHRLSAFGSDAT
ncbi:hypothetical protein GCM10009764_26840 [Nocardia ninae]|uniref:Uncharacterized protein n=1 Tax=Nocardia ninae NBRC 108245 TaxID=1210091 RepID=A0A511MIP9_9NOCA|nr:hypothetical protein NN4_48600 [Nocardia ninae NBRC 108245]